MVSKIRGTRVGICTGAFSPSTSTGGRRRCQLAASVVGDGAVERLERSTVEAEGGQDGAVGFRRGDVRFSEDVPELLLNVVMLRGSADRVVEKHSVQCSVRKRADRKSAPP